MCLVQIFETYFVHFLGNSLMRTGAFFVRFDRIRSRSISTAQNLQARDYTKNKSSSRVLCLQFTSRSADSIYIALFRLSSQRAGDNHIIHMLTTLQCMIY